ncbi:MAG: cytochrome P450 [Myxococcales bacterium]|nr:cytochrome P450 [Myxococcales bacterium]
MQTIASGTNTSPLAPRSTQAPLVPGAPLIGSGLALFKDPYRWWARQYERFGPVFRVRLPIEGGVWTVLAGTEANALLARDGARLFSQAMTYPRAKDVLETPLHPSITEGELQVHLKRQIAPGFSRHAATPHLPKMAAMARDYVRGWMPGQRLNVVSEMARLGINCISIFATGEEVGHETDAIARYATVFTGVIAMSWPFSMMKVPAVNAARRGLDSMIAERLASHRASPPGHSRPPDYFDFLLEGTLPGGEPLPERVRVVFGQIPFKNMGVYAGRVINHTLYQLVKRPEVLAAVQPEIDAVFSGEPTPHALLGLEGLRATIKETLRVLPIAVALQRTVCEPFEFGGYRFDLGDRLFFPISVPHFLASCFPEPERFDIGRFLPGRLDDIPAHAYKPFGLGNHGCVAAGLFEMITTLVLGTILHEWRLHAPYELRTIVDALPGPWPWHEMRVVERRRPRACPTVALASLGHEPGTIEHLFEVVDRAELRRLRPGEVLFRQGDPSDLLYLVQEGTVRVERRDDDDREARPLASLGAGSVVGEIGILHGVPRTATVIAETAVTVLAVTRERFQTLAVETDVTAEELASLALRRHASSLLTTVLESGAQVDFDGVEGLSAVDAAPGEVLVRQGEAAHHFYVLAQGEVEVLHETPDGRPVKLATLRAPDCFGEIGLLEGRPRTATVRAGQGGARVLALDRHAFHSLIAGADARTDLASLATQRLASQVSPRRASPPSAPR